MRRHLLVIPFLLLGLVSVAQTNDSTTTISNAGWFSLGGRSTLSLFDHDGTGLGTGGQFRIQISNKVNTDWFADYIAINMDDKVRSEYVHIGWSVLYYPFDVTKQKVICPYVLAGHCFDYNKKTEIANTSNYADRWGSAVQAGLGIHWFLSKRVDISFTSQYMMHLTNEIEVQSINGNVLSIVKSPKAAHAEGHLLNTLSFNCKLFKLWKR